MKKIFTICSLFFISIMYAHAQQRVIAECTVTYSDDQAADAANATSKTVYIKANQSRTEITSASFSQTILFDKTNGSAVILRDIGGNKFISKLDNAKWKAQNALFDGVTMTIDNETKTILGYECKKTTLKLKDGSVFNLYYATGIIPSVKEFEYQFKDVPGFVLEYDAQGKEGKKIHYTATKINLSPVQASKFDVPTSGYRVLN